MSISKETEGLDLFDLFDLFELFELFFKLGGITFKVPVQFLLTKYSLILLNNSNSLI